MPHDQLFKELLRAFFHEFLALFFPRAAARLDFSRVTFLDKEVFTDFPEGNLREPDLVAQVYTLDGVSELVLLHIEVQAKREHGFSFRMFEYYALLRLRYRIPVFPAVIYLAPGAGGLTEETYTEALFEQDILSFTYGVVGLPDLSADDYRELDNPLASGLSALMKPAQVGRALQKVLSLKKALDSPVDEARKSLLTYVIDTYLKLSEQEEEEFDRLSEQQAWQEVAEMVNVHEWIRTDGERKTLVKIVRAKFGNLSEPVIAKIEAIETEAELDKMLERILKANSLDETGLLEA
jgi:hypothetical protein